VGLYADIKKSIYESLAAALIRAREAGELSFGELPPFTLEEPREKEHGDLAANAAMLLAKEAKKPPREIAALFLKYFERGAAPVTGAEIAGPGFINLRLDPAWLTGVLPEVLSQKGDYGRTNLGAGCKLQVEFVSANPTGLLHMGNARGAALGDALAALLTFAGYAVEREFYINDTGNQVYNFALSLEARYFELLGGTGVIPENGYHGADITETMRGLIALDGDKYLALPEGERRACLAEYALAEKIKDMREVLTAFGVHYDCWFSEKSLHESGYVEETLALLREAGFVYEKDGATWLKLTACGGEKDEVLRRQDGTTTYFAADIAYHRHKFTRGYRRIINIWGADHHGHVDRLQRAVAVLGFDKKELEVILMQLVRLFKDGELVTMSKRSGQSVTLQELMEEVGPEAARFFFLMRAPDSPVDFDLDLARAQTRANPVYYVQYAHARQSSILRNAVQAGYDVESLPAGDVLALLNLPEERALLQALADFPEEIETAARLEEPHRLTTYVLELAGLYHSYNDKCRVLQAETPALVTARLALVRGTRQVIANALGILGVTAPERM
jgi:arginyl-tRNA synthetase